METNQALSIQRSEYQAPGHWVDTIDLHFTLHAQCIEVRTRLAIRPNPEALQPQAMRLHGQAIELASISADGLALPKERYTLDTNGLLVSGLDSPCTLEIRNTFDPSSNTALSGIYTSNGNIYSQCEAEGFRRITFFPDRPDIMATYTVTIDALAQEYPTLLSNGNLLSSEVLANGWHRAVWHDPFPKPSYLFALVAGRFDCVEKTISTSTKKEALLQFYVEPGNADKTAHAMQALVDSIAWDEERFGLALDLDRYMVVAVGDFNMGAMENKGLNIFNTKYVFANPDIATDTDYAGIESVIGHEYFHNWTGNRVTCRDWFQLTLKEGLTVFRDQEFSSDMLAKTATDSAAAASARAVNRIDNVSVLRTAQFPEDAGPMAHPIRPDSYEEINNFYTATVYEKGSEVIRMLQTLVGRDGFRKGMDLYFQRHDGQAVTCDAFVAAIADANHKDLKQFMRWYEQAGTPRITVRESFDDKSGDYSVSFTQTNPHVGIELADRKPKTPLHIPIAYGLLDSNTGKSVAEGLLELKSESETLRFSSLKARPVLSALRDFSAPVIFHWNRSETDLSFLAKFDSDAFNRWEAFQQLYQSAILSALMDSANGQASVIVAVNVLLADDSLDMAYKALCLTPPTEAYLAESYVSLCQQKALAPSFDPVLLRKSRRDVIAALAHACNEALTSTFEKARAITDPRITGPFKPSAQHAAARALQRVTLLLSCFATPGSLEHGNAQRRAEQLLASADNMTDRESALLALRVASAQMRDQALASLESRFTSEPLAMDKWFNWQASMPRLYGETPVVERIRKLMQHPGFTYRNPNRVRSLLGSFFAGNAAEFHDASGSGYELWAEAVVELSSINPQIAARMARALDRWNIFTPDRRELMHKALNRVANTPDLPSDVAEIVTKALAAGTK